MELGNANWWHIARQSPCPADTNAPLARLISSSFGYPARTRALLLAWNSLRTDPATAQVLLGMTEPVAEMILNLTLDEIVRIAQARFRHVRPRWDDRPATWRRLVLAAQTADADLLHEFNVQALQLLTGDFIPPRR